MKVERKKIVIIGGGIAGLSAGIYAEQSGFRSIILEKHNVAGGLCTGWNRKGYYLDGCTHWLNGTKPDTELYNNWINVGAFNNQNDIIYLPSWGSFDYQGTVVTFWKDTSKALKEWLQIAPEDEKLIKKFFYYVECFKRVELPVQAPINMLPFKAIIRFIKQVFPVMFEFLLPTKIDKDAFIAKFKNPAIKFALTNIQPGKSNLYTLLYSYASVSNGNGGIPKGGALKMANNIKERYESLGGVIKLNSEVKSLEINNKKITGVVLTNGEVIDCDYVITACDVDHVLTSLLNNKYYVGAFDKRFNKPDRFFSSSCCLLHFVSKNMPKINTPYSFDCEPFMLGKETISHITVRPFYFDENTFGRNGKIVIQVLLDQTSKFYSYWNELYSNKFKYNLKKKQLSSLVMARIIKQFPEVKDDIECLDVATPKTFARYTNSYCGSFMSFNFTSKDFILNHNGHVPGIKNLVLAGQWVSTPGGLPLALTSGKFAVQRICKKENHSFLLLQSKKSFVGGR